MVEHTDLNAERARWDLAEALVRVGQGDRAALRDVYDRTRMKLFGICLRICEDREAAEDVLQDVYILIWRKADQFDATRASPITWLSTLARNRAIDWYRARHPLGIAPLEEAAQIADPSPSADALLVDAERAGSLRTCLDKLGQRDQQLITTAFFEGSSYSELAQRAAQPLGTIKSRIRRALISLKACLGDG